MQAGGAAAVQAPNRGWPQSLRSSRFTQSKVFVYSQHDA